MGDGTKGLASCSRVKFLIVSCVAIHCIQVATKKKRRRRKAAPTSQEPVQEPVLGSEETADTATPPMIMFFHTSWCPHCERVKPELEKIKRRHPAIDFMDVDVEKRPDMASRYNVKSVPQFIATINGMEVDRRAGFANASDLEQMVEHVEMAGPGYRAILGAERRALPPGRIQA